MKDYADLTEAGRHRRLRTIANRVLASYDLDVVGLRSLPDSTSSVYRVDTGEGGPYALRVGIGPPIGHTKQEMESEVAFLRWVDSTTDIVVPFAVPNRAGEVVVVAEADGIPHERSCVLFSWLKGPNLADRIDQSTMFELGRIIAELHEAGRTFAPSQDFTAPTYDSAYPWDLPFILFEEAGDELLPKRRRDLYRMAEDAVVDAVSSLLDYEPPRMTHADIHPWNVKVYRGSLSVFDFEDLLWAWPVQDLATTLYYFWSRDDFDECWAYLRTGYETMAPWPDRGGEVAAFIMGRTLVMGNDVLSQQEFVDAAPTVFANGERRIADMLSRIEARR